LKHPHNKLSERALILTVLGEVEISLSTLISNDVDLHVRWWGHCQSSTCTRAFSQTDKQECNSSKQLTTHTQKRLDYRS